MIEIRIPRLGLTMENAIVAAWQAADGAVVRRDDILLTIETDKLTFDVPAPADGILVRVAAVGAVCAVEAVVGYLAQSRAQYNRLRRRRPRRRIFAPPAERRPLSMPVLRRIPITGARRRIFENMRRSLADTAQFSLHTETDAGGMLKLRRRLKDEGLQISYNAMLIKIAAAALRKHQEINVSVEGDDQILVWKHINIGLAMHIDDTLVVPVFHSPHTLSLRQVNMQINACMRRIKRKRLSPDELSGGTFTITNLGFADIDYFTPILRPPESAVLGVGRIVEKAVVSDGKLVARPRVGLSLTVDHRIIDGAPAARFLHTVKQMFENPAPVV